MYGLCIDAYGIVQNTMLHLYFMDEVSTGPDFICNGRSVHRTRLLTITVLRASIPLQLYGFIYSGFIRVA